MKACDSCFAVATWPANASPPEYAPSHCDFGHGYSSHTRQTTAWVDSLTGLLSIYETASPGEGEPIEVRIQADWGIFALPNEQVRVFLESAFDGTPDVLQPNALVKLRSDSGQAADHAMSWVRFAEEIRFKNRYFPQAVPDKDLLSRVLLETRVAISSDTDLFRARVVEAEVPLACQMGAPPAEYASAGRANPVGIAHLYLSFDLETCIYETRVANHTRVAVGTFRPRRKLQVLNLADIDAPDFFSVREIDSIDDQIAQVSIHRYLKALSAELQKPVRASDHPADYIPTQYLCELAKALGLDGVLYRSSLHEVGRNLVLFDVGSATCIDSPKVVEITALTAVWRDVAS